MAQNLYQILRIAKNATQDEIKAAYHRMILRFHPDKNQNPRAKTRFLKIRNAFEVLTNKRETYDKLTYDETENDSDYLEDEFYDADAPPEYKKTSYSYCFNEKNRYDPNEKSDKNSFTDDEKTDQNQSKNSDSKDVEQDPPIEHNLPVTLEELLKGCTKKMKISRIELSQDKRSSFRQTKILTIDVKPGWKAGTKIIFAKEGDRSVDRIPANIIFIIKEKPHQHFCRNGNDILYTYDLTLKQALCGFRVEIPTLADDETTSILVNGVTKPHTVRRLIGKGLPNSKNPSERGDLVVTFDILFPGEISIKVQQFLEEEW